MIEDFLVFKLHYKTFPCVYLLVLVALWCVDLEEFEAPVEDEHVLLVEGLLVETHLLDDSVGVGGSWGEVGLVVETSGVSS